MQINLEFPIARSEKLQPLGDRLPEALDRALQQLTPPRDDRQIVELFDSHKSSTLSQSEAVELDRYLLLEHWVRLAKAHAYKHLQTAA
jgi:hypothetical protein